jgi:XTP/dITP diphosphohydrolase
MKNKNTKKTILLATSNVGKLKEFQAILDTSKYNLISLDSQNIQLPEETGLTFVENALIKARAACHASGLPSLADDSGLVVPALNGAPGIYSARFAGEDATDLDNREKLLNEIKHLPLEQRQAYFHCVIVFMAHENAPIPSIAQASWDGVIINTPRGTNGFGYDPIFYLPSIGKTAAELLPEEKNQLSHRALALQELRNTFLKII